MPYIAPEVKKADLLGQYTCACDFYSFGVTLFELAEKAFPYGPSPEYESLEDEFVSPALLGEDGVEIPHLYDLLSGLIDWDPAGRLGSGGNGMADLKADPFWGGADWELVEARKMPSPLAEHAQMMANQDQASADGVADGTGASLATIMREMERADAQQKQVEAAAEADNNDQKLSSAQEALLAKDNELEVDGWEFVSQHALAQEYLSSGK